MNRSRAKRFDAPRRSQRERSAETRRGLIEAAITCICEVGYANTTTSDVARRASVTRGALQHHFGRRVDLLIAVIDHLSDEMLRLTSDLPSKGLSLEGRVAAMSRQYWTIYKSPTFLAVLDIILGAKSDPKIYSQLRTHIGDIYRVNDKLWHATFADTGVSPARLRNARRVLLAALRGLAVAQILGIQHRTVRSEIALIEDLLCTALLEG